MQRNATPFIALALVFFLILIFTLVSVVERPRPAARPITTFESDVRLNQDGSALVLENYEFAAPAGSFTRNIVTDVPASFGGRRYFIDIASVDDEHGRDVPYFLRRSHNGLEIHVPALTGNRLQIAYKVRNAVQFGAENDEFVWIANPSASPIETAGFKVTLPESANGQVRAQAFLHNAGANSRNSLFSFNGQMLTSTGASSVESVAPGPLTSGVAAIMHVSVPSGLLTSPGAFARMEWFLRANPIVFVPLCVFAVMYVIWRIKRRDSHADRSVVPLYGPPDGLTPAEVGTLIDDKVDPRDVTATLIDLAVRGYVKLERIPPEQAQGGREDYIVRLLKPKEQWLNLKLHERTMLFHTFYGGHWTQLSSLKLRFPDIVPHMRNNLFDGLRRAGMYRVEPELALAWNQGVMVLFYVLFWGALQVPWSWVANLNLALSPTLVIACVVISALIVLLLSRKSSPKTIRGMRTYIAVKGFEEFLKTVEGDILKRTEPGLFEKYLPYAMALGIEHRWTKSFEGMAVKTPEWFDSADIAINPVAFGHALEAVLACAVLGVPRGRMPAPVTEVVARAVPTMGR